MDDEVPRNSVGDAGKAPRSIGSGGVDEVFAPDRLAAEEPQHSGRAALQDPKGGGVMECDDLFGELGPKTGHAALGEDLEQLRDSVGCRTRHWRLLLLDGRPLGWSGCGLGSRVKAGQMSDCSRERPEILKYA